MSSSKASPTMPAPSLAPGPSLLNIPNNWASRLDNVTCVYCGAAPDPSNPLTGHPHPAKRRPDFDPLAPCNHFVQSQPFFERFARLHEHDVFDQVVAYCGSQRGGPLGGADILLTDDNGDTHVFDFESFCYHHQTLTIGLCKHPHFAAVAA